MPARSAEPTATFAAPGSDETALFIPGTPARGFDEELRRLLRSRLILVHLLVLGYAALLGVMNLNTPEDSQLSRDSLPLWVLLAVSSITAVVGAVVLWQSSGISMGSLRRWELFLFATQAAANGVYRYYSLTSDAGESPIIMTGFRGVVTLHQFSYLILAYGVLIPNTRRRALAVVAGLAAVPFVTLAAGAATSPTLRGVAFVGLTFQAAANLVFPAAIAVFAAARAFALQRRAYDAERRAEQVGQYTLGRKLGEGGMGEVFLAEHRLLKRPCAVKFIRPELAAHPATAARFAREVQAVTGLTHVNTVRVYDYGRANDGSFYYVMEYLDGPTLDRLVADYGPLPPGRVVHLLRQLCGALAEAHAAGLVHRDLKPGNVIVARLGGVCDVAKLLDFGLVLDECAADGDDRLTRAGVVLGTPAYMAPEQAAGEPVDARGDVYSLGAVAYYALLGRPPFGGKNARQVMAAHRTEPVPPLDGVPADLAAVVARCLAKYPADRFPTVRDLDRALAACGCAADWSAEQAATWWEDD
jgi:serine/threonine-protein kinase